MYETVWTLPKGMRRYSEPSKDQERLVPLLFCSDCIIATRGYDFREGQVVSRLLLPCPCRQMVRRRHVTISRYLGGIEVSRLAR
jgi:hypothetical protein